MGFGTHIIHTLNSFLTCLPTHALTITEQNVYFRQLKGSHAPRWRGRVAPPQKHRNLTMFFCFGQLPATNPKQNFRFFFGLLRVKGFSDTISDRFDLWSHIQHFLTSLHNFMVQQLMGLRKLRSDLETVPMKLEIEDSLQQDHTPLSKRFKPSQQVSHHHHHLLLFNNIFLFFIYSQIDWYTCTTV